MTGISVKLPSNASVVDMKQEIYWKLFTVVIRFSALLIINVSSVTSDPPSNLFLLLSASILISVSID